MNNLDKFNIIKNTEKINKEYLDVLTNSKPDIDVDIDLTNKDIIMDYLNSKYKNK